MYITFQPITDSAEGLLEKLGSLVLLSMSKRDCVFYKIPDINGNWRYVHDTIVVIDNLYTQYINAGGVIENYNGDLIQHGKRIGRTRRRVGYIYNTPAEDVITCSIIYYIFHNKLPMSYINKLQYINSVTTNKLDTIGHLLLGWMYGKDYNEYDDRMIKLSKYLTGIPKLNTYVKVDAVEGVPQSRSVLVI
jgi:hypothetical protein